MRTCVHLQHPYRSWACQCVYIFPVLGRQRLEDPGVLLASQASQSVSSLFSETPCSQKVRWRATEEDVWYWIVTSICMHTQVLIHTSKFQNGIKVTKRYLPLSIFWAVRGSKFKYFCNSGVQFFTSFSLYLPFQRKWLQGFFNWINRRPYIKRRNKTKRLTTKDNIKLKEIYHVIIFLE